MRQARWLLPLHLVSLRQVWDQEPQSRYPGCTDSKFLRLNCQALAGTTRQMRRDHSPGRARQRYSTCPQFPSDTRQSGDGILLEDSLPAVEQARYVKAGSPTPLLTQSGWTLMMQTRFCHAGRGRSQDQLQEHPGDQRSTLRFPSWLHSD